MTSKDSMAQLRQPAIHISDTDYDIIADLGFALGNALAALSKIHSSRNRPSKSL